MIYPIQMKNKLLILIMARKGSRDSISRQNLRLVNDKPLIHYVLQTALNFHDADVFVSTDSEEIKEYSMMCGAQVIPRPRYLTKSSTSVKEISFHALKILEKNGMTYDKCLVLHPKFPMIQQKTIKSFFSLLKNDIQTVFGIAQIIDSKLNYSVKTTNKKLIKLEPSNTRSALLNRIVSFKTKNFLKQKGKFIAPFHGLPLSNNELHSLSSYHDFKTFEQILNRKKILVRIDATVEIGLGHVYNMLTILNHLRNDEILIVMNKNKTLGANKFKEQLYNVKFFSNVSQLDKIILNFKPDIIFNDILNTSEKYMKKLQKFNSMIVNFEDLGNGRRYANLVFNPIFSKKRPLTKEFYGGKYACVRDEFRIWTNTVNRKETKKILISFGGTDPANITSKILECIKNNSLKEIEFTVILGYGFEHKNEIKTKSQSMSKDGFKIKLIDKSDFLAKYIRDTDFAIISNGRTVFEVACMNVPVLSVAVNDREKSHSFVNDHKIGKHMIFNKFTFSKNLSKNIQHMLLNTNRRKYKSNLKKLELLNGVERVIEIINNEFNKRN
ncbi:MAG: hypothetical protein CMG15_00320 [Candidatus Marinimicrobia bacterium]|nr:hypothetical protein [Candidatus Neomarinimicrobiota bacterium]